MLTQKSNFVRGVPTNFVQDCVREVEKKIIKISFFGHKMKTNKDKNTKFGTHKNKINYFDVSNLQFNSLRGLGTGQKLLI